ncbi:MAG: hypothetical protein U0K52_05315 [Clostridia bacterium]|nr:hypothetical protein [Clostridia bacterium]
MVRKPNYCKGIIIAHGKSELLLAEHIKSNLHLPIEIYSLKNGKTSIQIDSLMTILGNNDFKNKSKLKQKYIIEEKNKKFINFFIMPIMDLDDTTEEKIKKYKNGEMFKNHWLSPYIIPIWNDINLDHVLYDLKLISKLPNDKEKGKVYEELFPKNTGQADLEQVNKLLKYFESTEKTNMNIFVEKCLESLQTFK